jgi:hypothetical protein
MYERNTNNAEGIYLSINQNTLQCQRYKQACSQSLIYGDCYFLGYNAVVRWKLPFNGLHSIISQKTELPLSSVHVS